MSINKYDTEMPRDKILWLRRLAESEYRQGNHEYCDRLLSCANIFSNALLEKAVNLDSDLMDLKAKNEILKTQKEEAEMWNGELRYDLSMALMTLSNFYKDIRELMANSEGVQGLHLNGDVAAWDSITEGGEFEGHINLAPVIQLLTIHQARMTNPKELVKELPPIPEELVMDSRHSRR